MKKNDLNKTSKNNSLFFALAVSMTLCIGPKAFAECEAGKPETCTSKDAYAKAACASEIQKFNEYKPSETSENKYGATLLEDKNSCISRADKAYEKANTTDPETCKDKKADFKNIRNSCIYIVGENPGTDIELFRDCHDKFEECTEHAREPNDDEDTARECRWFGREAVSKELLGKQKEAVEEKEKELMESLSDSQVNQQKLMETKQEIRENIQKQIEQNMAEAQQALIDLQSSDAEFTQAEKKAMDEYRSAMNNLRAKIRETKLVTAMQVENVYQTSLSSAMNNCKVKAVATYTKEKERIQASLNKGQGVSMQSFAKWANTNKADKISFYMNTCIEDDSSYSQEVVTAQRKRNEQLAAISSELQKLNDDVLNLQQSFSDQMNIITKSKTSQTNALNQKHAQLMSNIQTLQQELQQMAQPKQSEMVEMLQQQQSTIREHQALQGMKEKVAVLDKVPLEKDDFELLRQLSAINKDGDIPEEFESYIESCMNTDRAKEYREEDWNKKSQ